MKGAPLMKISLRYFVLFAALLKHEGVVAAPVAEEPLVLELSVACQQARLTQQLPVKESAVFYAVTRTGGVQWTISGRIGRVVDAIAPVELKIEAEDAEGTRLVSAPETLHQLKVDEFQPPRSGRNGLLTLGVWIHRGIDGSPAIIQALARRDEAFEPAVGALADCLADASIIVPELLKLLADPSLDDGRKPGDSIRVFAAETLGAIAPEPASAAPPLLKATKDFNPYVRQAAALALWRVNGDDAAIATTIKLLDHGEAYVRYRAARAMETMSSGPSDCIDALPVLKEMLRDEDRYVRLAAARALLALQEPDDATECLRELSDHSADVALRRLAKHVLDRHAAGSLPDPLP